jgi:ATP-binding cassette subfamily B (MDR/TAP) protein 1
MLMPVSWYEKPENEGGSVASRYGLDVKEVSTLVTAYIPVLITNFTTIIGGVVLCLAYLWQIGLLSLFTIPLIALGGYISVIFIGGYDD